MARLVFHGAAQQVTGSMHILEAAGKRIVLDCGLFQGRRSVTRDLNRRHPFDPKDIHAVILSHAHIDHSGRLPLLVKDGFGGVIHATPATRDLSAVLLADSAHIQREDAHWLNKKQRDTNTPEVEPLYTTDDAVQAVRQMQCTPYHRWFKAAHHVHARYFDAGHMLGSAGIEIEITENGNKTTLVFSGDTGRPGTPILRDPEPFPACDYLICESTYGGRSTEPAANMNPKLAEVVRRTVERRGRILIPAFSVGRTQTIVYGLRQLFRSGQLNPLPVYVDSPLAVNATDIYRLHPDCYDRAAMDFLNEADGLLDGPEIRYVRSVDESKGIMRRRSPCIVIAAGGMCEGGRILHHLRNEIADERNTILIVGFQAQHTLGRRLVEKEPYVGIYGEKHKLNAEVVTLNGFSSHADAGELKKITAPLASRCRKAFLVHGELDQAAALSATMRESGFLAVHIPAMGETFDLD